MAISPPHGPALAFDACFEALTGATPYAWQRRLHDALVRGDHYDALDLPTGLGKTSVIAIWLIARANGARLPRRLVYVVDRRAVVDQATEVAETVADRLAPDATGILAELRRRLGLSGELPVSTLRGQHLGNRRWLDDPAGSAIVVGTVDMIGSRLLFEGYGVSRGMRPAHAGLLGADSLVVLDEAHLVPPFEALVRQAAVVPRPEPVPAMRVMSLSATGRDAGGAVFRLDPADRADAPAAARLGAVKRLWLMDEAGPKEIAQRLADQAWRFGEGGRRVVVFCNSRKTAQDVQAALRKRQSDAKLFKGIELTALLVGERRYRERQFATAAGSDLGGEVPDDLKQQAAVFRRFLPGRAEASGHPAFLVATSAGEVGVDLDADDLVCDLVAWERMVQRFGRVNRRPEPGEARIAVVPVADDKEAEDAVAAERLAILKAPFLAEIWPDAPELGPESPTPPETAFRPKDASPGALAGLKGEPALTDAIRRATTPEPLRPPLTAATLEAWSLTALADHPGRPKIEPWLRGFVDKEPQTTVLWRRLFPLRKGEERATDDLGAFFEAAPPHMSETLEAPSWRVAKLLVDRAKAWLKRGTQPEEQAEPRAEDGSEAVENAAEPDAAAAPAAEAAPKHAPVIVLLAADRSIAAVYEVERLADIKPDQLERELAGRTAIVDARLGGLDRNGLFEAKAADAPATSDMADAAIWGEALLAASGRRVSFGRKPAGERSSRGAWRLDPFRWAVSDADDAEGVWIEVRRGGTGDRPGDPAVSGQAQSLDEHHAWAEAEARSLASRLGLAPTQIAMLAAVARIHDRGKDRKLWQDAMGAERDGRPYAKTAGGGNGRALNGYRHEFGTLREIATGTIALPLEVESDKELRDLALHLIAAHHGNARPVVKPYDPDGSPSEWAALAREAALRFARLQRRWGPWGLAWWEALLRAADWTASVANDERGDERHG